MVKFDLFGMKRVLLSICMIITTLFIFSFTTTGCSNKSATSTTPTKTTIATSTATTKSETQASDKTSLSPTQVPITTTVKKTVSDNPFTRMEDTLDDQDVYFQKTWLAAELIGAKEGYKYATYSGTFELYLFDKASDAYQAATKNNAISLTGTLYPAFVKDGFAIYFYDNAKEELRTKIKGILFQ